MSDGANKMREIAERYFADDARGDLDTEQWGLAMTPGDVLFLLEENERLRRVARIDRRKLSDGVEPMVGQRVVKVQSVAEAWHMPHAYDDKVHEITSLLGGSCHLVECAAEQVGVAMLRLAPPGSEVTCPYCSGWREQEAKRRADAEVYRREQIGEIHRFRARIDELEQGSENWERLQMRTVRERDAMRPVYEAAIALRAITKRAEAAATPAESSAQIIQNAAAFRALFDAVDALGKENT